MEVEGMSRTEHGSLGMARSPATTPMLSPENWERILSYLPSKDFRSAINTCPEWNQLMTPKKNGVLFPKILPILIAHLPRETTLACRQLSKNVKNKTDELLANDYDFEVTLTGSTKIAKFISLMESRPFPEENPFLSGSVVTRDLQGTTDEQTARRVEAVRQVLVRYGHHVRRFQFTERPLQFRILETYVSLLSLLPNLESITIFDCLLFHLDYDDMRSLRFPKLDKLEELRFDDLDVLADSCYPCTFSHRFLDEYGHQLTSLALHYSFSDYQNYLTSFDSLLPNLKRFEMYTWDCFALKKLATINTWGLEVLHLSESYGIESLPDLLAAVNNFATTLVVLDLMWNPGEVRTFPEYYRAKIKLVILPKLKMLTLLFVALKVDWIWEFLKHSCKQLKTIYLEVEDEREVKNVEEIGMYARKLFSMLPMLSKIVIDNNSMTAQRVIFRKAGM